MDQVKRVKAFIELHELILFFAENRDQPVEQGFDFFNEIKVLCNKLELDYNTFIKEFNLKDFAK